MTAQRIDEEMLEISLAEDDDIDIGALESGNNLILFQKWPLFATSGTFLTELFIIIELVF